MRLLIVSDYYSTWDIGGASRVLNTQVEGLLKNERIERIELISGYPGDDAKEKVDITWYRKKYKSVGYLPFLFFKMLSLRFKQCPDIVHVHQPLSGFFAALVFMGIPKVYHFHSFWFDEKDSHSDGSLRLKVVNSFKRFIENFTLKQFKSFVVLSQFSKNKLKGVIGNKDIHIIPGCLDLDQWSAKPSQNSSEEFSFISVRRLDPRMGLDVLLNAFATICIDNNCKLTIVGTGRDEQKLHDLRKELSLQENVIFTGRISDNELKEEISKASCMVIPTKSIEGFGMTVIEAFAMGLPVLATKSGALVEFCEYDEVFHAVEKSEVTLLDEGLRYALNSFKDRESMRKKCRKVASVFDIHNICGKYIDIYKELKC